LDGTQILGESFLKRRKYIYDVARRFLDSKTYQKVREKLTIENNYDLNNE
jgi:hypothetical protein